MSRFRYLQIVAVSLVLSFAAIPVLHGQEEKKDAKEKENKIATVDVVEKRLVVFESFDGILESIRMHEVKTDFETWKELKVETVVDEGSVVSQGDHLITFDTKAIDKAVKEAEFAAKNSAFDLETARLNMKEVEETFEMDQKAAERTWKNAQQDYEYYQKVELAAQLDDLDYGEKSAGYFLEYSQDELDQLEQMYTEDELTEESEAIVLKRAQRSVETAERSKERTLRRLKRSRETEIPRATIQREEALARSEIAYKRQAVTLPIKKQKAAVALTQSEFSHKNKLKSLEDIRSDREKMTLNSPADGVVYYGKCVRGKWVGGTGAPKRKLEHGNKVAANAVVLTIVDVKQVMIRASLDESELQSLAPGMTGKALVNAAGHKTMPVEIKSIARIPMENGKYDCQIEIGDLPEDANVMPGMSCKLSFKVAENQQAIVAPKASVFSDDNGVTHYVYLLKDGKPIRTDVKVGFSNGNDIEIIHGVEAGDKIAKSKP